MIVALDFFTVTTVAFQLRYHFVFVLEHRRRRIVRVSETQHPTAEWGVQQFLETYPEAGPSRYAILTAIRGQTPASRPS